MVDGQYDILEIVASIRESMDIESAVKQLQYSYEQIISHYCSKMESVKSKQILMLRDNLSPRYWNCVNIHNSLKEQMLWMSINPSGAKKDKRGNYIQEDNNCQFNLNWNLEEQDKYWKTLISNIGTGQLNQCGHLDILPIHLSKEKEVWHSFFKDTTTIEFQMVVDLVMSTQALLENIKPKLIIYSNVSTKWLWGIGDSGWMGYILEPVEDYFADNQSAIDSINELRKSINGYWHSNPGKGLFRIKGIADSNISHMNVTNLDSYLLLDYQVANYHWKDSALQPGDLNRVWKTISSLE